MISREIPIGIEAMQTKESFPYTEKLNEAPRMCGQISFSLMCNLRHSFCFQGSFSSDALPPEIMYQRLRPMYPSIMNMRLLGGEPTIIPGVMDYITWLKTAYPHIALEIVTNGVAFDERWIQLAEQYKIMIQVSINAFSQAVFDRILRTGSAKDIRRRIYANLEKLIERHHKSDHPIINCISMVLSEETAPDLLEIVLFSLRNGLNLAVQLPANTGNDTIDTQKHAAAVQALIYSFYCEDFISIDVRLIPDSLRREMQTRCLEMAEQKQAFLAAVRAKQNAMSSRNRIKDFLYCASHPTSCHCLMPEAGYVVLPNGDMLPCCHLMNYPIGNIHEHTAEELMNSPRRHRLQQLLNANDYHHCWHRCKFNRNPASSLTCN